MEDIHSYIYSIASAAIICAVLVILAGKSSTLSPMMKLMCGVIMTAVIIAPLGQFQNIPLQNYLDQLNLDARTFAEEGMMNSREAMCSRIIESTQAYILEKASAYDLELQVTVRLDETLMTPAAVEIHGAVSPSVKRDLQEMIAKDLGISTEAQTWK